MSPLLRDLARPSLALLVTFSLPGDTRAHEHVPSVAVSSAHEQR